MSFDRPLGEVSTLVSSVVQAFDDHGDGLVLRGHDFRWDEAAKGRSPHLPVDAAHARIEMVLERYASERKQSPRRVVVHKSSWYEPAELEGFEAGPAGVPEFDLLALRPTSDWRLLRFGRYPPLRGTVLSAGEQSMLYTNGWVPELGYDHGHVPSPLEITDLPRRHFAYPAPSRGARADEDELELSGVLRVVPDHPPVLPTSRGDLAGGSAGPSSTAAVRVLHVVRLGRRPLERFRVSSGVARFPDRTRC